MYLLALLINHDHGYSRFRCELFPPTAQRFVLTHHSAKFYGTLQDETLGTSVSGFALRCPLRSYTVFRNLALRPTTTLPHGLHARNPNTVRLLRAPAPPGWASKGRWVSVGATSFPSAFSLRPPPLLRNRYAHLEGKDPYSLLAPSTTGANKLPCYFAKRLHSKNCGQVAPSWATPLVREKAEKDQPAPRILISY